MMSYRGQASWAKMMSPGGKLTAPACHLTKRVKKAEELAYISTNMEHTSEGHNHRDKTRVQMPAKIFPHLKVK
jgi:hypothetical protein